MYATKASVTSLVVSPRRAENSGNSGVMRFAPTSRTKIEAAVSVMRTRVGASQPEWGRGARRVEGVARVVSICVTGVLR